MKNRAVSTEDAPAAIGPYSQAVIVDLGGNRKLIYSAGQIALDPATMEVVEGGIEAQTRQVLENLTAVLAESGATWEDVVKTTIFLADMSDFAEVNALYGEVVSDPPPARSTVAVKELPKGVLIEIEVVAAV